MITTSLPEARAWIDDEDRGLLPLDIEAAPGEHKLKIAGGGYRDWEDRLHLAPGEHRQLFFAGNGTGLAILPGDPSRGFAVMIDNQDDARPQFGLNRADVVYEAFAEGGITRYMALYLTGDAEQIGPIRSARHYFVNWATEYLTPLVHIGASPQGFQALAGAPIPNVNGRAFYRTPVRRAPHDAITNRAMIETELRARPASSFGGLHFRFDPQPLAGRPAGGLRFSYGPWGYVIGWAYDAETNRYARSMNGEPALDAVSGEMITADNVLVLYMESWPIAGDEEGRLDFRQVGSGRLVAFSDGGAREGTWSRSSLRAVTEYRDAQGNQLLFTPGNTWIQVVQLGTEIELLSPPQMVTGVSD